MTESIAARVGRLISGGFNALVDAVENLAPETVLEEALRELDSALQDIRGELGKEIASKHLASKRILEDNARHETLSEQIALALKQGRDDLAEAAIAKQLDIEAQIPILEQSIAERSAREKELEGFISALNAKKREMQDDIATFRKLREEQAHRPSQQDGTSVPSKIDDKVSKADAAFERIMRAQTGLSARSTQDDVGQASKLAELEDLSRKNRIQERLAAAKATVE